MNVKPELAEDIFSIEPENIKLLTLKELESYRLGRFDLAYKERIAHWEMEKYGMTREQLMSAKQNYDKDSYKLCNDLLYDQYDQYIECLKNFRIKHGLFYMKGGQIIHPGLD